MEIKYYNPEINTELCMELLVEVLIKKMFQDGIITEHTYVQWRKELKKNTEG